MPAAVDSSTKRGASAAVSPALVSARPTARTTASATSAPPTAPSTSHNAVRRPRSGRPASGRGSRCPRRRSRRPCRWWSQRSASVPASRSMARSGPGSCARCGTSRGQAGYRGPRTGATGRTCVRGGSTTTDCALCPNVPCWRAAQAQRTSAPDPSTGRSSRVPAKPKGHPVRRTGGPVRHRDVPSRRGGAVLRRRLWVFLALSVVLLAACGDDDGGGRDDGATAERPAARPHRRGLLEQLQRGALGQVGRARDPGGARRPAAPSTSRPTPDRRPSSSWPTSRT